MRRERRWTSAGATPARELFAPPGSNRSGGGGNEAVGGGSLIEAQEQERHRIAHELRDDVVQRLALLSLEREGAQEDIPNVASEHRTQIGVFPGCAPSEGITDNSKVVRHWPQPTEGQDKHFHKASVYFE